MAMKDIKSIEVDPADEDETIQLWMSFGWELKNNQRVKTQDVQKFTGQDSDGTKHYETTQGVDFIKLTFERSPEIKNYSELKSLEEQYYGVEFPSPPDEPVRFGCLWLVLSVIGLFLFVVPGIAIIIWRCVSYPKKEKVYEQEYAVYKTALDDAEKKCQELLKKAKSLV
jgi:hypothetical protein